MLEHEISKLGKQAYFQSLKWAKYQGWLKYAISGSLDMEYDKEGLISVQIGINEEPFIYYYNKDFNPDDFWIKDLKHLINKSLNFKINPHKYHHLFLASYWSIAELSQIKNFWEDAKVRNVTASLLNVSFPLQNRFNVTILDVFHFFSDLKTKRKDLDTVAKFYGLEGKIKLDGYKGKSEKFWKENIRKLLIINKDLFEEYAKQDVVITERLIKRHRKRVFEETGIDIYRHKTNGAIAISYFRQKMMKEKEVFGNENAVARKFILQCAHGAVMSALKRGWVKQVYENDFSSFYTTTSTNTVLLPRNENDVIYTEDLNEILNGYDGWCEVDFEFPLLTDNKYPCLPVQEYHPYSKKKSIILFPRSGKSFCTVSEIRVAKGFGCKLNLRKGYYYNEGTDSWSEFAKQQIKLREEAKKRNDEIGSAIHKNMPNSAVGKLFQHKGGFNIEKAKLISDFLQCPLKDVVELKSGIADIDRLIEVTTNKKDLKSKNELKHLRKIKRAGGMENIRMGVAWLPEWWSIILGRARAVLWYVVNRYGKDPVHLSTDSFHDIRPLNGALEIPYGLGTFNIEEKQATSGKDMFITRTKVNVHGDSVIHHSVHLPPLKARNIIKNNLRVNYEREGRGTIRDSILTFKNYGVIKKRKMAFQPEWDNKLKIITDDNGKEDFRVWEDINEFFDFVDEKRLDRIREREMKRTNKHKIAINLQQNFGGDWYEEDGMLEKDEQDEDVIKEAMRWIR